MLYMFPHLSLELNRMNTISEVDNLLIECEHDLKNIAIHQEDHLELYISGDEQKEFMIEIIARRWQKDLMNYRSLN